MAYIGEHMLLQWGGTFRAGNATSDGYEQFVGSLRFQGGSNSGATGKTNCDRLADLLKSAWTQGEMFTPANCFLEFVKWNGIGIDGKYQDQGDTVATYFTGVPGSRVSVYPTQIAWATTWDTDVKRGRAAKGRTYWPTAVGLDPLRSTVAPQNAKTMADFMLRLIGSLNSVTRTFGNGTMVATVMSNVGTGAANPITGARQGIRFDVQRRRGAKISEAYQVGSTS